MVLLAQVSKNCACRKSVLCNDSSFQPVIAMRLVQVRYNVLIQVVNVPVMLDTRVPNVMLHVVVTLQVQVEQLVMLPPGNVLVTLDTQGQHVIHVLPTTTERVMALAQVSEMTFLPILVTFINNFVFQHVVVMPQVQAACNVQIHPANAPVMLVSKAPPVIPCVDVTLLVPAEQLVMHQLVNVLATQVTPEPHVTPVPPTTTGKVMELVQVRDILRLLLC